MQEVSQLTPELQVRSAPMVAWQRRTVLGMLIVLATLLNATLEEIALGFESLQLERFATVIAGVVFAQASLLAVWGGLTRQPLPVRIPSALGVAAIFGLALVWGNRRGISEEGMLELACLVVLLVLVQALMLLLVRRYWKWQLGVSNDGPGAENTRFGLRTVLLWTAATAALLAIGRWVVPRQEAGLAGSYETVMTMLIILPIATTISLPLVIPSVGLVLGQRRRLWAAAWLALMSIITFIAFFTFMCLGTWMSGQANSPWEAASDVLRVGLPMHVGLITTLLTGLLMLRLCGFRLLHRTNEAAVDANFEKPAAIEQPAARWQFAFSVTGLLLLIAALLWPAWKVEQRWRAYSQLVAVEEEWEGLGMDVTVEGERITSIDSTNHFDPSAPIAPAALEKLRHPRYSDTLVSLYLSGTLTDEQMESLAHLTNLELLWLDDTQITGDGLVHLQNMSNLTELSLDRTQIGDEDLKALPTLESLEYLFLSGTNVTEAGLAHLQDLPNLRHVSLDNTKVSEEAANEFNAGLNQ